MPGPKPGTPKPEGSGRKPGTPNKVSEKNIDLVKQIIGYAPLVLLAKSFMEEADPQVKRELLLELCTYCHAKPKAIEITGADGGAIEIRPVFDRDERHRLLNEAAAPVMRIVGEDE
jgi:hypothetical protein